MDARVVKSASGGYPVGTNGVDTPTRAVVRADSFRSRLRAALIRGNPCSFADRYSVGVSVVGEGAFGRVHCCIDNLAQTKRAVKRIPLPANEARRSALKDEVEALVLMDHPHIVRLIEYFFEDSELMLVMELLEGPTLRQRMTKEVSFSEELAARCARHMLKALFCCHCQGIAHNDVSPDNFKFTSHQPDAALKMVDFGLSKRCFVSGNSPHHAVYAQERDIWGAGAILFEMLRGNCLFPQFSPDASPGSNAWAQLVVATDPAYVPSRLRELQDMNVSPEAMDLLKGMLEPSNAGRIAAREALMHPWIIRTYPRKNELHQHKDDGRGFTLTRCVQALRSFHEAAFLKRLALLIVAHLMTSDDEIVAEINYLFRFLIRDGHRVQEWTMRKRLEEAKIDIPADFANIFKSADICGKGGLDYVEFVAAAIIIEPKIYCRSFMLQSVFRFLDVEEAGMVTDGTVQKIFGYSVGAECSAESVVLHACGSKVMSFSTFRGMMMPQQYDERSRNQTPAAWADKLDPLVGDAPAGPTTTKRKEPGRFNPVKSSNSEAYAICQKEGFHKKALRKFYSAQAMSNVLIGICRGTSGYARQATSLGLTEIIQVGSKENGAFFIMPNPKYHWKPSDCRVHDDVPRVRFVAWWIHPDFLGPLREWFQEVHQSPRRRAFSDTDSPRRLGLEDSTEVGAPGDFGFSEVRKPQDGYLHTYRDLQGKEHVHMIEELVTGVRKFLEKLMGSALTSAKLSAGFHYPVRAQYSTLHLQVRVNSGEVCGGTEGRGKDLLNLRSEMREDSQLFSRDEQNLHYEATLNLRATMLAAAAFAGGTVQEVGPQAMVLTPEALH